MRVDSCQATYSKVNISFLTGLNYGIGTNVMSGSSDVDFSLTDNKKRKAPMETGRYSFI